MTAHRSSRIHWRTMLSRIKTERGAGNKSVMWRTIVQTFYPEGVTLEARRIVDNECEETLQQLVAQGRVSRALGLLPGGGMGLVVWLEKDTPEVVEEKGESNVENKPDFSGY